MNPLDLLVKLKCRVIFENDTNAAHELALYGVNYPDRLVDVIGGLTEAAFSNNNDEHVKILVSSLRSGDKVDPEKELIAAVVACDLQSTKSLLEKGVKLEGVIWGRQEFWHGYILRCCYTRVKMLELLIQYGLDIGSTEAMGLNLLHDFVRYFVSKEDRDTEVITEILLNAGASVNEIDYGQCTPLYSSIRTQNTQLISFLLKKGANVNKKSVNGCFPLHEAAKLESTEILDLLLSSGAEINARDLNGNSALHEACSNNNESVISLLLQKGADMSVVNCLGRTPFSFLDPSKPNYDQCKVVMIKELAKLTHKSLLLYKNDLDLIKANPRDRECYEKFFAEF